MANRIFNQVPGGKVKRNAFNLSHERKLSLDMGKLVPIMCTEVVPGDTFRVNSEIMLRFAPMFFPVMHRIDVYVHYFFVPNRIIWNEFEQFITGGEDGKANPIFPRFRITRNNWQNHWMAEHGKPGDLADYLGVPSIPQPATDGNPGDYVDISMLPFRAYAKIYDEYYRDQDLIDPIDMSDSSGIFDATSDLPHLQDRCWEKDYFTSARPWAQKGDEVSLPIAGAGDLDVEWQRLSDGSTPAFRISTSGAWLENQDIETGPDGRSTGTPSNATASYDPNGSLYVDLSKASFTAATINELRRAFQLQKWMERNARSGSRYTEVLRAHFGVKSSDARLQRPEYLGGGRQKVSISEVLQTSETTENSPQGEMAGHGISIGNTNRFKAFFEEHGYVMGIMSVLPRTAYQQGLPRHLQKFDRFDYYWREFAHVGEQEIKNSELFVQTKTSGNNGTFGYAPRYSEYKYIPSTVHGDMRDTLRSWHLGRFFGNVDGTTQDSYAPKLNELFVKSKPATRIFNVQGDYHHLWCHIYNNVKAIRPMPVFGEPGLIDH